MKHNSFPSVLPALLSCGIVGCSAVPGDAALRAGQYSAAVRLYESGYRQGNLDAGFRLADMYGKGIGVPMDQRRAFEIYTDLSAKGVVLAHHNLGVAYEYGKGTPINYQAAADAYRKAADVGYVYSTYNLGSLYANEHLAPDDDVLGLALLLHAQQLATGPGPQDKFVRDDEPGHIRRMMARMTPPAVDQARALASARASKGR